MHFSRRSTRLGYVGREYHNNVDVVSTNDAPVAADGSHTFTAAEFDFNDSAEGNPLDSVIITRLPSDGTLTLRGSPCPRYAARSTSASWRCF